MNGWHWTQRDAKVGDKLNVIRVSQHPFKRRRRLGRVVKITARRVHIEYNEFTPYSQLDAKTGLWETATKTKKVTKAFTRLSGKLLHYDRAITGTFLEPIGA